MKHITDFVIEKREQLGEHYFSLVLRHPGKLPPIAAGQFVEVEVKNCREVLLRRPISIHDVDEERNTLTLLIRGGPRHLVGRPYKGIDSRQGGL